jgi:hypothetical protein
VTITGSGANEVSAGLGFYLREHCSMVIGWPRGGGSNLRVPAVWPDASFAQRRVVPWSYAMNVCTHSYSLVWYGWAEWSAFIDWMALSGINNFLAETGQEEIAWKVLTEMGLNDTTIRNWFNGPALLTWSRGQNEYGGIYAPPPHTHARTLHHHHHHLHHHHRHHHHPSSATLLLHATRSDPSGASPTSAPIAFLPANAARPSDSCLHPLPARVWGGAHRKTKVTSRAHSRARG